MSHRRDRLPQLLALVPGLAVLCVGASAGAAGGGLEIVPDLGLLLVLLVAFAVLVYPVNSLLFRPIFRVLDAREERLSGTRRQADRLVREADTAAGRYESAIAKCREEALTERNTRVEQARREGASEAASARRRAEAEVERSRTEMAAALADARGSLRAEAEALARQAAARLLGRTL